MLEGAPLDLRVNLLKASREEVLQELAANGVEAYPTPFSPDGVRLPTKPGLTQWPIYKEGKVDVQDEGSQLIARLLTPRRREMICDFCAGAGGKTLAIGALMRSTGSLYAFDVNESALRALRPACAERVSPTCIRSRSAASETNASAACRASSTEYSSTRRARAPHLPSKPPT